MHYYSFHIGDFRGATAHLSNAEELAYRRALDWYYDTEAPIPLETQWVARRLRVEPKDLQSVLHDFFTETADGWIHHRCDREIAEYYRLAERNRENGKKGGRPKTQNNPVGFQSVPSGNPAVTQAEPRITQPEPTGKATNNHKPITINQEPINTPPNPPSEVKPKKPPKEIRAVALPPGFEITPEMRAWAAERRLSVDIDYATERWKNSMVATGKKYSDWTRAWNNGMLKADEWAREKNPNNVTPLPSLRPRKEMPLP